MNHEADVQGCTTRSSRAEEGAQSKNEPAYFTKILFIAAQGVSLAGTYPDILAVANTLLGGDITRA
jgi:hypothetical protein